MYHINDDVTIYYKQIYREYSKGKENFDKRYPIMEVYNVVIGRKGNGQWYFRREWRRKHGIKPLYM